MHALKFIAFQQSQSIPTVSCLILAFPLKTVVHFPQLSSFVSFFIWLSIFQPDGFPDQGCFAVSQAVPLALGCGQCRGKNEQPLGLRRGQNCFF